MPHRPADCATAPLVAWEDLDAGRQLALRIDYGHYLDRLPPACSLEERNTRFARWLAQRGVRSPR